MGFRDLGSFLSGTFCNISKFLLCLQLAFLFFNLCPFQLFTGIIAQHGGGPAWVWSWHHGMNRTLVYWATGRRMGGSRRHQPQRPCWWYAMTARGLRSCSWVFGWIFFFFLSPCRVLLSDPTKQHQLQGLYSELLSTNPLPTYQCCRVLSSKIHNLRKCPTTSSPIALTLGKTRGISSPKGHGLSCLFSALCRMQLGRGSMRDTEWQVKLYTV